MEYYIDETNRNTCFVTIEKTHLILLDIFSFCIKNVKHCKIKECLHKTYKHVSKCINTIIERAWAEIFYTHCLVQYIHINNEGVKMLDVVFLVNGTQLFF